MVRKRDVPNLLFPSWSVLLLAFCGCGGEPPAPAAGVDPVAIARGETLYLRVCASCHGKNAGGVPALGKSLRGNTFTRRRGDGELVEFLKAGRPSSDPLNQTGIDMPPYGGDPTLTDDDLENVVAFLRTL